MKFKVIIDEIRIQILNWWWFFVRNPWDGNVRTSDRIRAEWITKKDL